MSGEWLMADSLPVRLESDVHYCVAGAHAIFLSLRQDRYVALPASELGSTRAWRTLQGARLLARDAAEGGKPFVPTHAARPCRELHLRQWAPRPARHLPRLSRHFMWTIARAEWDLRTRRLDDIVAGVRRRRALIEIREASGRDALRRRTTEFQTLRPWYWRPYRCLFDSLALLNYLQRFDLDVSWVFGVRSEPFEAHCWLQIEAILVNDALDKIAAYTPILVV